MSARSVSGLGDLRPVDIAKLAFFLGRLNQAARPHRLSLRLPPACRRALLVASFQRMAVSDASELAGTIHGEPGHMPLPARPPACARAAWGHGSGAKRSPACGF